jgi:hypothetical protein
MAQWLIISKNRNFHSSPYLNFLSILSIFVGAKPTDVFIDKNLSILTTLHSTDGIFDGILSRKFVSLFRIVREYP